MPNPTTLVTLLLDIIQTTIAVVSFVLVMQLVPSADPDTADADAMCHATPFAIEVMAEQHTDLAPVQTAQ